jgi:hypothetical protein
MADDIFLLNRLASLAARCVKRCCNALISSEASYAVLKATMKAARKADAMVNPAICAQPHRATRVAHSRACRNTPSSPCAHLRWPLEPHDPSGTVNAEVGPCDVVENAYAQCNSHDNHKCKLSADRGEELRRRISIRRPLD